MGDYPIDRKYTKDHEWARVEGSVATIGITQYAQSELGDVVYVALPELGAQIAQGQSFGEVESTKSVSELFAPVTGKVVGINDALTDSPETINADPHGKGWIVRVELTKPAELASLLSPEDYEKHIAAAAH
jgi:glycine cleavage system H protein